MASAEARPIQGTEGAAFPFWSPDSRFIAFFAGGKLKKVAIAGGPPVAVADAAGGLGGSWSRDNVIVFGSVRSGLFRVPSAGGVPTAVTTLADGEDAHRWPHFLPDGRHFFYTAVTGACCPASKPGVIKIGSLDPAEPAVALFQADSSAIYASGHVLFARDETLMAQAFDPDGRQLAGDAVAVTARVSREASRYVSASVSVNGTLVYAPGGSLNPHQLTWFDRAGKPLGTLGEGGDRRQSFTLARRTPRRSRPPQRESGESRHLDDRHRPQPAEPRDDRCAARRMAGMVARWHTHRVRTPRARHRGTAGEGAFSSDSGQRDRGEGNALRSRGHTFTAMWPATMRTRADRLVFRRAFRVVHVQRDVSADIGHLGPSALRGPQTVSSRYRLSSARVKERSPRTADGSPIRPTRPASPTSTFSHFFAPAGSIGSRRMEDGIRTGGPMAESCSISMRLGR